MEINNMSGLNLEGLQAVHDSVRRAMSAIHEAEIVCKDYGIIGDDTMLNEWLELYQLYNEAEKTAKGKGWLRVVRGW